MQVTVDCTTFCSTNCDRYNQYLKGINSKTYSNRKTYPRQQNTFMLLHQRHKLQQETTVDELGSESLFPVAEVVFPIYSVSRAYSRRRYYYLQHSWHQPGHLFTSFLQKYTSALAFFMDHNVPVWCSVATTQAILERFDPGLEIGEMKSQTKYSVHRLMMMQTGQKPPQHWRRAFHSVQQHRNSLFESLNSGS